MLIWFCLSENETLGQFVPLDPNLGQFNGFCGQALAVDIFFLPQTRGSWCRRISVWNGLLSVCFLGNKFSYSFESGNMQPVIIEYWSYVDIKCTNSLCFSLKTLVRGILSAGHSALRAQRRDADVRLGAACSAAAHGALGAAAAHVARSATPNLFRRYHWSHELRPVRGLLEQLQP